MRNLLTATLTAFALIASGPAAAQEEVTVAPDTREVDMAMSEMFGEMFQSEPLTEEQEARLPAATLVVASVFPDGTYARLMGEMMAPMLEGMWGNGVDAGEASVSLTVISGKDRADILDMDAERRKEAITIVDPAFAERSAYIGEAQLDIMTELMTQLEPAYQVGLARAYAKRFDVAQLTELDRFFRTPVGSYYAAESMLLYSDPEVMAAMVNTMPAAFEMLPKITKVTQQADEKFPAPRTVGDLSDVELSRLADLLGVSVSEIKANSEAMEEIEDAAMEAVLEEEL